MDLAPDQAYSVQVRANNAEGTGVFSEAVTARTSASGGLRPTNVQAEPNDRSALVTWELPSIIENVEGYYVLIIGRCLYYVGSCLTASSQVIFWTQ